MINSSDFEQLYSSYFEQLYYPIRNWMFLIEYTKSFFNFYEIQDMFTIWTFYFSFIYYYTIDISNT